jgi:hypothetical protein
MAEGAEIESDRGLRKTRKDMSRLVNIQPSDPVCVLLAARDLLLLLSGRRSDDREKPSHQPARACPRPGGRRGDLLRPDFADLFGVLGLEMENGAQHRDELRLLGGVLGQQEALQDVHQVLRVEGAVRGIQLPLPP